MSPSARIVIDGNEANVRGGVLYHELPRLMRDLYEQGKSAIAYSPDGTIVGEADPSIPDRWWARETPPYPTNPPRA